jgi:hypothetical protein
MDSLALLGTSGKTLSTTCVPVAGWLKVGTGLEELTFADAAGAWRHPVAGDGLSRDPATGWDAPEFAGTGCFESCTVGGFCSPSVRLTAEESQTGQEGDDGQDGDHRGCHQTLWGCRRAQPNRPGLGHLRLGLKLRRKFGLGPKRRLRQGWRSLHRRLLGIKARGNLRDHKPLLGIAAQTAAYDFEERRRQLTRDFGIGGFSILPDRKALGKSFG